MSDQINNLVLLLAKQNNFGKLTSFKYETNHIFTNTLVQYTSFFFNFKKSGKVFDQTNYIQVDFIENMIYIYNPINNKPYYCAVVKPSVRTKESKKWKKQFGKKKRI